MTQECPRLTNCGFFKKYQGIQNDSCNAFIRIYCRGEKQSVCKRLEYGRQHGHPPVDEMLPSGQIFHIKVEDITRSTSHSAPPVASAAIPPRQAAATAPRPAAVQARAATTNPNTPALAPTPASPARQVAGTARPATVTSVQPAAAAAPSVQPAPQQAPAHPVRSAQTAPSAGVQTAAARQPAPHPESSTRSARSPEPPAVVHTDSARPKAWWRFWG